MSLAPADALLAALERVMRVFGENADQVDWLVSWFDPGA